MKRCRTVDALRSGIGSLGIGMLHKVWWVLTRPTWLCMLCWTAWWVAQQGDEASQLKSSIVVFPRSYSCLVEDPHPLYFSKVKLGTDMNNRKTCTLSEPLSDHACAPRVQCLKSVFEGQRPSTPIFDPVHPRAMEEGCRSTWWVVRSCSQVLCQVRTLHWWSRRSQLTCTAQRLVLTYWNRASPMLPHTPREFEDTQHSLRLDNCSHFLQHSDWGHSRAHTRESHPPSHRHHNPISDKQTH